MEWILWVGGQIGEVFCKRMVSFESYEFLKILRVYSCAEGGAHDNVQWEY